MSDSSEARLLEELLLLAREAGARIMECYREADPDFERKSDASPVTAADRIAEATILAGLARLRSGVPVVAEEEAAAARIPQVGDTFFLVDPLDGTREFLNRTDEFTVNIALITGGRPVIGVVYAPALGAAYGGIAGGGAFKEWLEAPEGRRRRLDIAARHVPQSRLIAVASRTHRSPETDAWLRSVDVADFTAAGSSLKFCLIAEGRADVYPRHGRTMEWDTAAGQAVLEAAGGSVIADDGAPLRYGKASDGFANPSFIAWGRRA